MKNTNRPSWRPFAGATTLLLVLSVISFTVLRDQPARANHGDATIDVSPSLEVASSLNGTAVSWSISPVTTGSIQGILVLAEVEGGPNDPDDGSGANSDGRSYGTPDYSCVTDDTGTCSITFTPVATESGLPRNVRIWLNNGPGIDTTEGLTESTAGQAGCSTTEPDTTEVVAFDSIQTTTGTPPSPAPVPGANPSPYTCENPEPSHATGSGTPTGSTTTTPSPTDSTTVTPSPSGSTTVTPSPSGSTTVTPSPTGSSTTNPSPSGSTTVTPSPTGSGTANLTIGVTPTLGVYGTDFTIQGDLTCQGAPVSAAEIVITYQYILDPPQQFIVATDTGTNGHYALTLPDLISSSAFIASWEGNTQCPGMSVSGQVIARVRPGVIVNPTTQTAGRNQLARVSGRVVPAHPGTKVYLMILEGSSGIYRIVGETTQDAEGDYTLTYKMSGSHFLVFRTAWPTQHKDHVWNWSRNVRVN